MTIIKRLWFVSILILFGALMLLNGCKKDDDSNIVRQTPIISTAEVTKISQFSAQGGGVITSDAGFAVTARGVCWNTTGNPTINDNITSDGLGAGIFTSKLMGLTINTTYYLRAYATNSQGTAYGSTMIFETLGNTFTDLRDGNVYQMVTIGNQIWMAENLAYLPSVTGPSLGYNGTPYYYVYGYDGTDVNDAKATSNYDTYGVLYNWTAAMASSVSSEANPSGVQGVCPTGWHLPSDAEWTELTDYLGGISGAGGKLKETGTTHWNSPNEGATNETGFTALPAGFRNHQHEAFHSLWSSGFWWTASEFDEEFAWYRLIRNSTSEITRGMNTKETGYSVRCVKDN